MEKKQWEAPKAEDWSVKMTEYGSEIKTVPYDVIQIGNNTYYSFS